SFAKEIEDYNVKENFSKDIKKEFSNDFSVWGVDYNKKNSRIRFSKSDLLYQPGSSEIHKTFKIILKDFYPRYLELLLKYKDSIDEVIIIGHTSSENSQATTIKGKYLRNLVLSQKRAESIFEYVNNLPDDIIENNTDWLKENTRSTGLSSAKLILDKNGKENKKLSRRIEVLVKFIKIVNSKTEQNNNYENQIATVEDTKITKKLSDYVKQFLIENPTINEQQQLLNSIQQDLVIAKASFRPIVTVGYSQKKYTKSYPADKTDEQSENITIRYNLFNGFKDEDEVKIRENNYLSIKFSKEQIETDLIYALAEAFLEIQKQKDILAIAKKNLEDYDQWIEKENIRFENGLISLTDFGETKSRDTIQRMNYQELMRKYKDSVSTFEKYLNFNIEDIELFEKLDINSVYFKNRNLSIEDSKIFSPYIKEAEQNIDLYKQKMEKAKVSFYPTIDLIAKKAIVSTDYKNSNSSQTDETTLLLEANLALYSGGKDQADYEKKLFEYRQKIQKRDEVVRDTEYKIKLAHNKYELLTAKEQFLNKLIIQRDETYIGANYDYKFAKIDTNGLLDVVDDLYNAKRQYIENQYDICLTKYKILTDIGIIRKNILDE
ncbi:MAG: TolC family protein, partial [Campylobacterota bacterium]|nr:TolC family protein [Campylobacterota bacterium]